MRLPFLPYSRHLASKEDSPVAVRARALELRYAGKETPALIGLEHEVPTGARVALVGPNGSGKSTLIKAIAGLLPVAGGELRIFGLPPGATRRRVAYLPQRPSIDWRFPVTMRQLVL
jgi:manganese/zinc/iron transport system ATP- binding protein